MVGGGLSFLLVVCKFVYLFLVFLRVFFEGGKVGSSLKL